MDDLKISIIIPVFNSAKYLSQCIQSVIDQSLPEIEIIIINDGSTDESIDIIKSFAARDKRIIFLDGENQGVSAARNKGIKMAQGDFLGFIDADDWIEQKIYETLYQNAKESGADIAICNINLISANSVNSKRLSFENEIIEIAANRKKELVNLMRFKYDFANWNKIYSAEIIKRNHLLFDEKMTVYEDLLFNLCYFQFSRKGISVNEALYNYRIHSESVMAISKHDVVSENNLLFSGFNSFCEQRGFTEGVEGCNEEMRRGFYFAVIPKITRQVVSKNNGLIKKVKEFACILEKAVPGIYRFKENELVGNGFKKRLLKNKRFYLFSLITLFRHKLN